MQLKDVKLTKSRLRNINKAIDKYVLEFPGEPRKKENNQSLRRLFDRLRNEQSDREHAILAAEVQRAEQNGVRERAQVHHDSAALAAHSPNINTIARGRPRPIQLTPQQLESRRATIEDPTIPYPGYSLEQFTFHDSNLRQSILNLDREANRSDNADDFIRVQQQRSALYNQLISFREYHGI